jgi:hypothetical protein
VKGVYKFDSFSNSCRLMTRFVAWSQGIVGFGRGMVPRVLYKVCIFLWMTGTRGFVLAERMYCCSFNFFNLVNLDLY